MQPVPGTLACNAKTQEIQTFSNQTIPDEWICSYSIFLHEYGQYPIFFGSTAEKIVRTVTCPVLTVPYPFKILETRIASQASPSTKRSKRRKSRPSLVKKSVLRPKFLPKGAC
jgi:hypothetical protein